VVPLNAEIVTLWSRSNPEHGETRRYRITCDSPNQQLFDNVAEVDLTDYVRRRMRAKIDVLPIPESGTYYFNVYLRNKSDDDWCEVARIPLQVTLAVQE